MLKNNKRQICQIFKENIVSQSEKIGNSRRKKMETIKVIRITWKFYNCTVQKNFNVLDGLNSTLEITKYSKLEGRTIEIIQSKTQREKWWKMEKSQQVGQYRMVWNKCKLDILRKRRGVLEKEKVKNIEENIWREYGQNFWKFDRKQYIYISKKFNKMLCNKCKTNGTRAHPH